MFSPKTSTETSPAPKKIYALIDELEANKTTATRTPTGDFAKITENLNGSGTTSNLTLAQAFDNLYQSNVTGVLHQLTSQNNFNGKKDTQYRYTYKDINNNWYAFNSFDHAPQSLENEYNESEGAIAMITAANVRWQSIVGKKVLIKKERVNEKPYLTIELLK